MNKKSGPATILTISSDNNDNTDTNKNKKQETKGMNFAKSNRWFSFANCWYIKGSQAIIKAVPKICTPEANFKEKEYKPIIDVVKKTP